MSPTFPERETSKLIRASSQGCAEYITSERDTAARCPYCHASLDHALGAACVTCETWHHTDCLVDHGSCAVNGCESSLVLFDETEVFVTDLPVAGQSLEEWRKSQSDDAAWESDLKSARQYRHELGRNAVAGAVGLIAGLAVFSVSMILEFRFGGPFAALALVLCFRRVQRWLKPSPDYKPGPGISLWHDVFAYGGFDPITGMGQSPSIQSEDEAPDETAPRSDQKTDGPPEDLGGRGTQDTL